MTSSIRVQTAMTAVLAALALSPAAANAAPSLEAEFAAMDADKDGYVTQAEWKSPGKPFQGDLRALVAKGVSTAETVIPTVQLDQDGDRQITFAEYRAGRLRGARFTFHQMDLDGNGAVTHEEYVAYVRFSSTLISTARSLTDAEKAAQETGLARRLEWEEGRYKTLDTDGDGVISRAEFVPQEPLAPLAPAAPPAISIRSEFAAMDADKDGFITATELKLPPEGFAGQPLATRVKPVAPAGVDLYKPDGTERRTRIALPGQTIVPGPDEVLLTLEQSRQLMLNRYDPSGDEKLDINEYALARVGGARYRFNEIDKDFDGRLSREEYLANFTMPRSPSAIATFTEAQMASLARADERRQIEMGERFSLLDTNRDGFLSRLEMIPG